MGTTSQAVLLALSGKNDLGVHTQYLTDEIMKLISKGIITNKRKNINDGKAVDLTGQVAAGALPLNYFAGVTGMLDFRERLFYDG